MINFLKIFLSIQLILVGFGGFVVGLVFLMIFLAKALGEGISFFLIMWAVISILIALLVCIERKGSIPEQEHLDE